MRIGIYTPYLDTLTGGERYMLSIAQCFKDNHDVEVLWDDPSIIKKAEEKLGLDLGGVKVVQNIFNGKASLSSRLLFTRRYDALVFLSDGSLPLTLAKRTFVHFQFPVEWIQNVTVKEKIKLQKISSVFCNSKFTKSFIDKKFGINSKVLYPPITIPSFKKLEKENMILHVGRFSANIYEGSDFKKQHTMIDVFKQMIDNGLKKWKFIIATSVFEKDMNEFMKMQEKAKGYPIEFVINKGNDVIVNLYQRSKIYWHATGFGEDVATHPERVEHFGISTCEAMSWGAVPVVINRGGQREIVEDGVNGYTWDTLDQLKQKTNHLISDKKELEQLSIHARESINKFSYERFCKEVKSIIY